MSATPARSPRARRRSADGCEVALGVGEQALLRRDVRQQELRLFVVRPDFEDLLVERGGFRVEPLAHQVVGDAMVLPERLVHVPGAEVQVAEEIGGVPIPGLVLDNSDVLADGRVETSLAKEFLAFFQRAVAIEGQGGSPQGRDAGERQKGDQLMVSKSDGGRNDCRCTGE